MLARRVHHVSFPIRDLERARAFYEGVLGLRPIPRPNLGVAGIWYGAGDVEVHLIVTPAGVDVGTRPPGLTPVGPHTAFAIDDYAKALAALREHGLDVLETNERLGQMWVRDPDGNVFELIARSADVLVTPP
jgi:catechol 2,3-dioxygenase-like lactoylglutathione lyase family enzyme